jgi:4-amino-4-deoxy-L-arabinose transferase-like glycosyltransferase
MFQRLDHRGWHYLSLTLVWASVSLPNLGTPGLWDVDEGNNLEAAREMRESGSPIVPTFNYRMRVDKPVLLYWLQMASFSACGVNELAARIPSALAALAAVLVTYELGRRTFGAGAGLLAGAMLASAVLFCAASRFANPDALLDAFSALALFAFWRGYLKGGSLPFASVGAIAGLGMLAKGPVGLVLPAAVSVLFLAWQRELRRLADPRVGWGLLTFLLVAAPWYVWVGVETKGEWLKGFFGKHNVDRFRETMENHGGHFYYYVLVLLAGFAPWSVFFGPAARNLRDDMVAAAVGRTRAATRFLVCWITVYFVFFTIASTKLPNYILPAYPAVALLTGRALEQWRRGLAAPPRWLLAMSLGSLALMGFGVALGLLIAAGVIPGVVPPHRQLPALAGLAAFGLLPVAGAAFGTWYLSRGDRTRMIAAVACSGMLFSALLAAFGPVAVDRDKATRALAAALPPDQTLRDVRIGAYEYFQPSLVFYCQREVSRLDNEGAARQLLEGPLPAFLFVPANVWDDLRSRTTGRVVARHHDLYDGKEIVLVTNE